jgi:acyl-CoA dehydrogenase
VTLTSDKVEASELQHALFGFIEAEVMPIEDRVRSFLDDPRKYWLENGHIAPEIVAARREVRKASARAGFYTMFCPEELGGGGLGARLYFDVWEALCHRYGSPQSRLPFQVLAHTSTGPSALWLHASPALRDSLLGPLSRGELQGSFAMSEPQAGSDAWMMSTRAVRDGEEWVINGTKQWASWAPSSDFVITFAITDPQAFKARRGGLTCFYVPTDAEGYNLDSIVEVFGELGGEECILSYNDVRVPDEYRLGEVGAGFYVAMQGSGQLKLTKMGRTIGLARWALDRAIEYALVRETFGEKLIDHQTIRNMLSESSIEIFAAKAMSYVIAERLDAGEDAHFERSMANAYIFDAMYRVYDRAMQTIGGMSLANDTGMIAGWHTLRVCRMSEGPTEVQLRAVGKSLVKGSRP